MSSLPIKFKPDLNLDYTTSVIEVKNMISKEVGDELKRFALDAAGSGLHRRGSKDKGCNASFDTCLVFNLDHNIYELLDPHWSSFIEKQQSNITFIEPYEIKAYRTGDKFGIHRDTHCNIDCPIDRKLNLVIQLSESSDYEGGDLKIHDQYCSREYGTGIFFPALYMHSVTEITRGTRFSLIGHAWGPIYK